MTENINKETNDSKFSTDTLFVLLLVIGGLAIIFVVGSLLLKPLDSENDVITTNLIVPGTMPEDNSAVESVDEAIEESYLREGDTDEDKASDKTVAEDVKPVIEEKEEDTKPIFTNNTKPVLKQTATKTTVVKRAEKPAKKLVTVKAYWIQVGSFSTSSQAKKSVETLKERGLSSRIVLKNVNGKSVYRVRIGAYESKGEADKFCNEVKKIKGYESSYVSETTTQKYVNIN